MGAALLPELLPATLRIAREYRLPLLLPRELDSYLSVLRLGDVDPGQYAQAVAEFDAAGLPVLDRFAMTPGVPSDQSKAAYAALLTPAAPGLTYVALHPNGAEDIGDIQRHHPRAQPHWRTDELRLFGSGHCDAAIARAGVRRLGMRALRDLYRRTRAIPA
jgi:hypothetical protein